MQLNEIFDRIYIINLDEMKYKYDRSLLELKKINQDNVIRFSGIKINDGKTIADRRNGCRTSHINIIKECKRDGLHNVLIFEDDIEIDEKIISYYEKIKNFLTNNEWNLFYLGGNHNYNSSVNRIYDTSYPYIKMTKDTLTTHAYAINANVFDDLIISAEKHEYIDGFLRDSIQQRGKSFCIYPRMISQRTEFSYIENSDIDYNNLLKDKI